MILGELSLCFANPTDQDTTYFSIEIPGVPCPAKNQDMLGNDIHHQVVGTWDECGEYFEKSNFFERERKSYVECVT